MVVFSLARATGYLHVSNRVVSAALCVAVH